MKNLIVSVMNYNKNNELEIISRLTLENYIAACQKLIHRDDFNLFISNLNFENLRNEYKKGNDLYLTSRDGKYYLYFPARDKEGNFRLGVAESDSPVGPFTPDDNYIPGSYSIDPAVMVEGDEAYIYYGGLWGGQLEKWQTGEFVPDAVGPSGDEPALGPMFAVLSEDMKSFKSTPQMLRILDENGEPIKAGDEERRYFEAPWLHKYNGKYYLSYSTGTTHYIVYATSDSPVGPFTYGGRIMEPVIGWTTHHSIVEIGGKWYLFYHDCEMSGGINHRRTVKFTELKYNEDGSIVTIQPYDHK